MLFGQCKLCLKTKELQASHLLPAAVYRLCRPDSGDITNPIRIQSNPQTKSFNVFQTSRQIVGHVLCFDCEQLLNLNGEEWVIPQLSTLEKFPLYDTLTRDKPSIVEEDFSAYAGVNAPNIRTDKLVHFAMGIFWKAGVHNWQTGNGIFRLDLGPYEKEIRGFLLGEKFPEHAYLMVSLVPPSLPTVSVHLPHTNKVASVRFHSFYVPGVEFMLTLGKQTPDYLRAACIGSNPTRPIMVQPYPPYFISKTFAEAFSKGRIAPKLAKHLRKKGRDKRTYTQSCRRSSSVARPMLHVPSH